MPGRVYAFRQPQWDFYGVTVATALTEQNLFQAPFGQQYTPGGGAALTKTQWHTTMIQAGVFPSPQKFFMKALKLSIAPDTELGDANAFLHEVLVDFLISEVSYSLLKGVDLPQSGGPHGFSSGIINNGIPSSDNQFKATGALGEVIEQQQGLRVNMNPTRVIRADAGATHTTATAANGGTGINAHVILDGILERSVQ